MDIPKDISSLPFSIIPRDVEKTIQSALTGQVDEFIQDMIEFGMVSSSLL
jgi:hypothetical protein